MPELPEVETIRRGLEARIIGRTITAVRIPPETGKAVPVIKGMDESAFREGVVGAQIERVERRGKYLILHLDSGLLLVIHLRMTGALLFQEAPEDRFVRAIFSFDNGDEMRFTDLRKFGGFWLVEDIGQAVASVLGPEPFDEDAFTVATLAAALAGRKSPVKAIILDQRHVAGIGNIYADEACFAAGIDPRRHGLTLDDDEVAALHAAIRDVLLAGVEAGGASFKDYRNTGGNVGSMQKLVKVFRRTGKPCYTCGTTIERVKVGGRSTHFCPTCQR
ncbi:MAG: DNA-formamidopyrimidine glycosylase [Dehalococcoidia bacterium]